jgi:hypothetical protein
MIIPSTANAYTPPTEFFGFAGVRGPQSSTQTLTSVSSSVFMLTQVEGSFLSGWDAAIIGQSNGNWTLTVATSPDMEWMSAGVTCYPYSNFDSSISGAIYASSDVATLSSFGGTQGPTNLSPAYVFNFLSAVAGRFQDSNEWLYISPNDFLATSGISPNQMWASDDYGYGVTAVAGSIGVAVSAGSYQMGAFVINSGTPLVTSANVNQPQNSPEYCTPTTCACGLTGIQGPFISGGLCTAQASLFRDTDANTWDLTTVGCSGTAPSVYAACIPYAAQPISCTVTGTCE